MLRAPAPLGLGEHTAGVDLALEPTLEGGAGSTGGFTGIVGRMEDMRSQAGA